jgi:hypothetical protein
MTAQPHVLYEVLQQPLGWQPANPEQWEVGERKNKDTALATNLIPDDVVEFWKARGIKIRRGIRSTNEHATLILEVMTDELRSNNWSQVTVRLTKNGGDPAYHLTPLYMGCVKEPEQGISINTAEDLLDYMARSLAYEMYSQ